MDRWCGRIAAVTGAGSGIGLAIVKALFRYGVTVVGMDVNLCKFKDFAEKCGSSNLHALQTDVTKEDDVVKNFCWVNQNMGRLDILVNGAGVFTDRPLTEECTENMKRMLDVNVLGLAMCAREGIKIMREKCIDDAHIINICSMVGHWPPATSEEAFYTSTKHAVKALSEGLRQEFVQRKSCMRITQVSPGVVYTDLFNQLHRFKPERLYQHPHLKPEDIANAVIFALGAPPTVQVTEMIVLPVGQKMLGQM
ncbi:dehydrogenase/reductase SDR family member 11-like [Schistocerca gregaria]|uniref:dehydrogenase/reductase SDR family member 11-like n=1 Tax=Schistocerca gregaria TaxID=7010 RepID=UPI00211F2594|nr:dehydrogenase/reductase SDR family member 11-like [Schistocerca gregaria]